MANQQPENPTLPQKRSRKSNSALVLDLLLIGVIILGAIFRFTGIYWGEEQYLHPDERFLVWVGADISPVKSLGEYFDAANSSLNPNNRGHGFFVYGTLPILVTRYAVEWIYGHSGFNEMTMVGRPLSALCDLLTLILVFAVGSRQYNRRVGLLSAVFYAVAVLPIQLSHYFKEDTFVSFFVFFAIYFAVRISKEGWSNSRRGDEAEPDLNMVEAPEGTPPEKASPQPSENTWKQILSLITSPLFYLSIGFGVALGCAVASKLNALPVALMIPAAFLIRLTSIPKEQRGRQAIEAIGYLVLAAFMSILVFRIFQPYAFSGPGFFGLKPNPQWVQNIRDQRNQAAGDVDFPPALQWARRPVWFSGQNLTVWGLGLPLGILAWAGFLWAGWRMLKGEWRDHALLWGWTAFYFLWQSSQFNPTMRYQLPIYPGLTIFAGWAVIQLWDSASALTRSKRNLQRSVPLVVGGAVLLLTFLYAVAFTGLYLKPITRLAASRWIYQNIPGPVNLRIQSQEGEYNQPLPFPYEHTLVSGEPFSIAFEPKVDGLLDQIYLGHVENQGFATDPVSLNLQVSSLSDPSEILTQGTVAADLASGTDDRGPGVLVALDQPLPVEEGQAYNLTITPQTEGAAITLHGDTVANEGEWDDGIPYPLDGYNGYGGIYPQDINFNMYWDDNPEKLERFQRILDQSDYLFITSNRQWGSLPRLAERFPLVTTYYRHLLGCPPEQDIVWCYTVAEPGMFMGDLGFELAEVFESPPTLGIAQAKYYLGFVSNCLQDNSLSECLTLGKSGIFRDIKGIELAKSVQATSASGNLALNDQFGEEAFSVYDHPKVFIFKKTDDYDPQRVQQILGAADLDKVVRLTPKKADSHPANLMLPDERWEEQKQGGTWSELFNADAPHNRYQVLGVIAWYLSIFILGLVAYPITRLALPGLNDRGYPIARTAGLLVLSCLVWLAGSARIPANRLVISLAFFVLLLAGAALAYIQRAELRQEWRQRKGYFLLIEGLFLAFFLFDLFIRFGNPDLWHQWKGGERPMDFSYLNAVLKSTSFPPYDPWYAGGYLNYYYYGFVLVGVIIKWLGFVPAFAFNLVLPTIFSLIALGAFSVAWNIFSHWLSNRQSSNTLPDQENANAAPAPPHSRISVQRSPFLVGLVASFLMAVLGNLGTLRMIYQGFQRLAAPGGVIEDAGFFSRMVWAIQGFIMSLQGQSLPYSLGDWYWIPSRVMPPGDNAITEFPFFTVLYSDPHAHLFALPVALLALSWAVSIVLRRGKWNGVTGVITSFVLGGMAIGFLYPINLSDIYTYLPLGLIALGYGLWRYLDRTGIKRLDSLPDASKRLIVLAGGLILLVGLSVLLIRPYTQWYGQGYSSVTTWKGPYTPWSSYLTHWGLFLFIFLAWFLWETRDWMANTPLSALRKLEPYREVILGGVALVFFGMLAHQWLVMRNQWQGLSIAWLVIPMAAWAGILLLRPGIQDAKRIVLFLIGTGLLITMMVEVIVVEGDIGRQNTVFKFYLQVWTLFSICAAAAMGWTLASLPEWRPGWRLAWQIPFAFLVISAALFTLFGGLAKIRDRMAPSAPHTLDGMAYMQYAQYNESGTLMDLNQDYKAIRWMQENVPGSPVIVEANSGNLYRWYTRFTMYTGLPGALGWEWHQQQQRSLLPPDWVSSRLAEINQFYQTTDTEAALSFLDKYDVRYIVLGQLEEATYPGPGLDKFPALEGIHWRTVYQDQGTTIYEVLN